MPSVEMRRTTRVFGVAKGGGTACVLRSGKRLWPESGERKSKRGKEGDELAKKPAGMTKMEDENDEEDDNIGILEMVKRRNRRAQFLKEHDERDRYFGLVYTRKRKISVTIGNANEDSEMNQYCVLVVKSSFGEDIVFFSRLLFEVLRSITRFGLTLKHLSAFLLCHPTIAGYASQGIQFLQGSATENAGICQFFGIQRFLPLFWVDFSAIPLCFKYLHSALLSRYISRPFSLVHIPVHVPNDVEKKIDLLDSQIELHTLFKASDSEIIVTLTPQVIEINDSSSLHESLTPQVIEIDAGLSLHDQKKNSKRGRKKKTCRKKRKSPKERVTSYKKLRTLTNSCTSLILREANSVNGDSKGGSDSSFCYADILIVEPDRCYREEEAIITLEEIPNSRKWHLAVKKNGSTRYTFKAGKVMRPISANRYTHVRMITLENGWKLEFANNQDWIAFKGLYRECSDRDIPIPVAKFIPVPGVRDVSDYADSYSVPFRRPDYYISVYGDEFFRAVTRKTANYDMDSEDEEWLNKFNNNKFQEHVCEDNFELIVDALEKAYYYNPDDCYDEKTFANWCLNLVSKEVIEAIHSYWMRKRKQKCTSLLRVFQSYHQAKIFPLVPKPLMRKKRTFKRHPSQIRREKLLNVVQAATGGEKDGMENTNVMVKIEVAKAAANKAQEVAIEKRKRAEFLMENADLAMYKATVLVRIADAAQVGGSVDALAGHFLD